MKFLKKILIMLFLVVFVIAGIYIRQEYVSATSTWYYFSVTGNDSADGLSNATAWKSLSKLTSINFTGGETVCFNEGSYNTQAQLDIYLTYFSSGNITFQPCSPGQNVTITNYIEKFVTTGDGDWTNISVNGINMWNSTSTAIATSYPIVQFANGSEFINSECFNLTYGGTCDATYTDWFTKWNNTFYRSWGSDSLNEVKIIMANGENPNNVPLYISGETSGLRFRNSPDTGLLIIRGLNFAKHRKILDFSNVTYVLIENNMFEEGLQPIYFRQGGTAGNVTIRYNVFNGMHFQEPFYNDWIKGAYEESDCIVTDPDVAGEYYVPFYVYENIFNSTVGAVSLTTDTPSTMCGSQIHDNYLDMTGRGGYESMFEIEEYCCNSSWYNNVQMGGELASLSLGGANASTGMCHLYNNLFIQNDTITQNSTRTYETYASKAYNPHGTGTNVVNWNITHNTFRSKARSWYSATDVTTPQIFNCSVTDNIFITNTTASTSNIRMTGTDANGNYWNNNIYYQDQNGYFASYYMSDSSSTSYSTLAAAQASPQWDGQWDTESMEANPLLYDNFTPMESSPACGNASDGGDIGAIPCYSSTPTPDNVTISSINAISQNSSSFRITWTTNLPTNVTLKYGTTISMTSTATNTTFSTSHSQTINGLQNNTLYYFNITGYNSTTLYNSSGAYNITVLNVSSACAGVRGIKCVNGLCSYAGTPCTEPSSYRASTITCINGGCS